jgi:Carboxypeptidase regulatory-like domain
MQRELMYAAALLLCLGGLAPAQQPGAIRGRVKEQGGKALEGAAITAARAANGEIAREAKADAEGEFELAQLEAGDYVLTIAQPGFRTIRTWRVEVKAGETVKIDRVIELRREGEPYATVRGAVFRDGGFTLPNAKLVIERLGEGKRFKRETTSVEGGEFAFRLPAEKATYRVTATARGFQPLSKEVTIDGDEVRQVALSLERAN